MHQICSWDFTDGKQLNKSSTDAAMKKKSTLRSSVRFDWKINCFICSKQAIIDIWHKDKHDVQEVRTLRICANALQKCNKRNYGSARSVRGRLQTCTDLVAEEYVYNWTCYEKLLSNDRPWDKSKILDILGTKHIIYQNKGNLM